MDKTQGLYFISWGQQQSQQPITKHLTTEHSFTTDNQIKFHVHTANGNILWQDQQYLLLLNGYHLTDLSGKNTEFFRKLATAASQDQIALLKNLTGYFSLVIIDKSSGEVFLARDKYGCNPLYHSLTDGHGVISNYLSEFKRNGFAFDPTGLYESIYYRWLSGRQTLEKNIQQLPAGYCMTIKDNHISYQDYWQWQQLFAEQTQQLSFDQAVSQVEHYLDEYFQIIAPQVNKVLIPLSGGVDSSILAAKAMQHLGDKCVAGIIEFEEENPELEMARYFAQTLSMPIKLIKYADQDVIADCKILVEKLEQLPRHYSSMPFYRLLNHSDEFDAIIYGEPGDTFFGSHTIKRLLKRFKRMQKAKYVPQALTKSRMVATMFPTVVDKLSKLQDETLCELIHSADKIVFSKADQQALSPLSSLMNTQLDIDANLPIDDEQLFASFDQYTQLSWLKTYMMITDITDHLVTAERLLDNKNVKLLTPLTYNKIEQVAWQLSPNSYFGKRQVKEVLREIGCQYYSRDSMFAPKYGFSTPRNQWLALLDPQILTTLSNGHLLRKNLLSEETLANYDKLSLEMKWTLYHLESYVALFKGDCPWQEKSE